MISNETQVFLRQAEKSLKEDIQREMRRQTDTGEVPCSSGLREFGRLVEAHQALCRIAFEKKAYAPAERYPEAMCEATCAPDY